MNRNIAIARRCTARQHKYVVLLALAAAAGVSAPAAFANGAPNLTILPDSCRVFNGSGEEVNAFSVNVSHSLDTQDPRVAIYTCVASGVANSTGKEVSYNSRSNSTACGIATPPGYVIADSWTETVKANGEATLTCQFKQTAM